MLALFNDPEGPNLLVVGVLSAVVLGFSYFIYKYIPIVNIIHRTALVMLAQIVLIYCIYILAK
jgi:ABC-type multidrug transport system permease subunit